MTVEFNKDPKSLDVLKRAQELSYEPALTDAFSVSMDLSAANGCNGNPELDLGKLLAFPDFDFLHDVAGICRNINRETGKIGGHFLPKCAK